MPLGHCLPLPEPPFSQKQEGKSHPSGEEVMTKPGEQGLLAFRGVPWGLQPGRGPGAGSRVGPRSA